MPVCVADNSDLHFVPPNPDQELNVSLVLGLVVSTLLVAFTVLWLFARRTEYTIVQFLLDRTAFILLRFLWHTKAPYGLPLSEDQGAVIVANHRSSVDPFFIHLAAKRRVRWFVAREFFSNWFFGWFLNETGAIPTRRGGIDNASIREAVRLLHEGKWVGVLPEGRINTSDQFMMPVRPGAALLARKADVPILPVYIQGAPYNKTVTSPFFMRAQVQITVGDLIYPSDFESDKEMIVAAVKAIAQLAGQADYEPTLAGKKWKPTPEELAQNHQSPED
ncbi:lysophospholipid acyltransferase family protein [Bremerella sp. P1]|uniref:lysophospholipid acyltransferase family protein n=1 Tax=Bremerella sp. P1 TaxID=3026424 RepID=UPI0030835062